MEEKDNVQTVGPSDWASLASLSHTINQLSEQQCVKGLDSLFAYINTLETKVSQQENNNRLHKKEIAKGLSEARRLKEEYQTRQEETIEDNARLLRKKDDEKTALNQALTRQEDELRKMKEQIHGVEEINKGCQEQITAQDVGIKRIEAHLRETRTELERTQKAIKQHEAQVKAKDQDLQAEKKAHDRSKADIGMVRKQVIELQAALKTSIGTVKQIEELAPPLVDEPSVDANKALQKLWKQCVYMVQACFRDVNPEEQLQNPTNWHALRSSNLITHALPLPPTNSHSARRMRLFAVLTILADELARRIFTSSYLFDRAGDLEKTMLEIAGHSQLKDCFFRRILNSMSTSSHDELVRDRVSKVQTSVLRCIEPLLSDSQAAKLKQDLTDLLVTATNLWCLLRQQHDYFAVEPEPPSEIDSDWKSLVWNEEKKSFLEETVTPTRDVVGVLFPRIFMVKHEKEQEVFAGVLLMKSETMQASEELDQLPAHAPIPARNGTLRSNARRRATLDHPSENNSFLPQSGSHGP